MKSPIIENGSARPAQLAVMGEWELAAHYGNAEAECTAALQGAALRDATHLSRIDFKGSDHLEFLHRMTTNDFKNLPLSEGFQAVFPDNRGRIVEAGTFCRLTDDITRFVGGLEAAQKLPLWLDQYVFAEQLEWVDRGHDTCMIELYGPQSFALCNSVLGIAVDPIALYGCRELTNDGCLARTALGSLPGVCISGEVSDVIRLADNLLEEGSIPLGEVAFEALRVQLGAPQPGSELNEEHNPWEAGLANAVHLNKGCYIGQEVIARLDTYDKVKQKLMGLELTEGELPAAGTVLVTPEGRPAGQITAAVYSPVLRRNIALAYVRTSAMQPGTCLTVGDGGPNAPEATVADLPFVASR